MSRSPGPVKARTEELLAAVSFVDIHGRKIGYDYGTIMEMIKAEFPNSRISSRVLRTKNAYDMQCAGIQLPVRRRSRKVLAREYTHALLLQNEGMLGLSLRTIRTRIRKKFPGIPVLSLGHVEAYLIRRGYQVPFRPPIKAVDY